MKRHAAILTLMVTATDRIGGISPAATADEAPKLEKPQGVLRIISTRVLHERESLLTHEASQ